MPRALQLPTILVVVAQLMVSACGDDPTPPPKAPRRPTMVIVSGSGQTGEVGTTLPAPLVVRILDSLDVPAAGVMVRFAGVNASTRDSIATDLQGLASVRWTLDTVGFTHEIVARATVYPATPLGSLSATFSASATPGAPTRVAIEGGDGAVAGPGGRVDTVVVRALDRYGNQSREAPVTWLVTAGGGSVGPIRARTDERGQAQAIWHLGPSEGPNVLDVTVGSVPARVTATASVLFPGRQVVVGDAHSCALTDTGAAYCWGANSSGQLGVRRIDDTINRVPQRVAGVLKFTSLVAGAAHTCGVEVTGDAYCWGNGRFGQLGNGFVELVAAPARVVNGLKFEALAAGSLHTCGLNGGSIYCWGENSVGQLGDGVDRPIGPGGTRSFPVLINVAGSPRFSTIAAGSWSTCAISMNGGTYCWGGNAQRELGSDLAGRCAVIGTQMFYDGTTPVPCSAAPVRLPISDLRSLTVDKSGWCGVTSLNLLVCWGNSFAGPRFVSDANVIAAWVVGSDVCGRTSLDVACWGVWGGRTGFPVVRPFGDQVQLEKLAAGTTHSCGVTTGGRAVVHCWGDNRSGQLGDGTTVSRPLPVPVLSPMIQ